MSEILKSYYRAYVRLRDEGLSHDRVAASMAHIGGHLAEFEQDYDHMPVCQFCRKHMTDDDGWRNFCGWTCGDCQSERISHYG